MLIDQIKSDLKQAQLNRDEIKLQALRMLLSEAKYSKISSRDEGESADDISDDQVMVVAQKEVKKRNEAAVSFRQGGRDDLAQKEEAEAQILKQYLPVQMSTLELTTIIEEVVKELGASTQSDMGKVIGAVRAKVGAKADGATISGIVKEKLS